MKEEKVVSNTPDLQTKADLVSDFRSLGVDKGSLVLVHSSLSSLGWVCGGAVAVIYALMEAVTKEGTIVMPTFTADYSDPRYWQKPAVPKKWWPKIRQIMPAYQPEITPTRGMGKIPETFRNFPGVIRSSHPKHSFAAWGKKAENIVNNHPLDYPLGESSPLGKIYELEGWVLLLGVDYDSNTSFHLAEYRLPDQSTHEQGSPVVENGRRVWKTYRDISLNDDPFAELGRDFEADHQLQQDTVGTAEVKYFPQRKAVDFAVQWLQEKNKKAD